MAEEDGTSSVNKWELQVQFSGQFERNKEKRVVPLQKVGWTGQTAHIVLAEHL